MTEEGQAVREENYGINYELLPEHLRGGVKRYIEHGLIPGGFLKAVLDNDLKESFARADETSTARMWDIVKFMYNEAPSQCWGTPALVEGWHTAGGFAGQIRLAG
ncbi:hypothetical protein CMI37_21750 [Candidatus Pacearchaeota archaeon]|nr:hypothetical protein [Candidatus Pacearchaeota archaeon]|tara:strand:- start:434 stop:748 length:315 start_codon:yes stop_codon:yes gene_type:complete